MFCGGDVANYDGDWAIPWICLTVYSIALRAFVMKLQNFGSITTFVLSIFYGHVATAQQEVLPAKEPVQKSLVQRYDPFNNKLIAVPPAEIKPGFLYRHYSPVQGRDVWSIANEKGGFSYAMGQGSVQPAARLDIRASAQETELVLKEVAPRWAGALKSFGAPPLIILDKTNQWTLLQRSSMPQIMDLDTGRRWEWQGNRRVAVVHTGGYRWRIVDGKYVPTSFSLPTVTPSCALCSP